MKSDIIVIGGGASGLAAAIMAAREGAGVTILEHMPRIGKKLLATGNGRCNYTNRFMDIGCYHSRNLAFVSRILNKFTQNDTEDFFSELGILPKDKEGYVYPNSMQAASVLDALRFELERLRVNIVTDCQVTEILPKRKGFQILCKDKTFHCRRIILACGGKASEKLGSDGSGYELCRKLGLSIVPVVPALTGLKVKEKYYKALSGIRTEGSVTLYIDGKKADCHTGELQLAEYGISGIPVFQLSGQAAYGLLNHRKVTCELDFFPEWDMEEMTGFLKKRLHRFKGQSPEVFETGLLNRKLIHECMKLACQNEKRTFPDMHKLACILKHFPATVTESRGFDFAQVCAGGIDLSEIDPNTCESVKYPGLYITGELLDADGICGGYNLQWAWSTGSIAGKHAGKEYYDTNRTN